MTDSVLVRSAHSLTVCNVWVYEENNVPSVLTLIDPVIRPDLAMLPSLDFMLQI